MFGFGEDPIYSRDWSQGDILPQATRSQVPAVVAMPNCSDYVESIIARADCVESASKVEVLLGIHRLLGALLVQWANVLGLGKEVDFMFNKVILRSDYDFQMLVNALSYFKFPSGIVLGNKVSEYLQTEMIDSFILMVREGHFNKKESGVVVSRDWSQGEIVAQSKDNPKVKISNPIEYANNLITIAGRAEKVSVPRVLKAVTTGIDWTLRRWVDDINLNVGVISMFEIICMRDDVSLQMLIDALSYFGEEGVAVGPSVVSLLEKDIPEEIVPMIREGKFDEEQ